MKAFARTLALVCSFGPAAAAEFMIIGIDGKVDLAPAGVLKVEPQGDAVLIYDITTGAEPVLKKSLDLQNSLFGPPTNLLVTPDRKLALVADSVNWVKDGEEWTAEPNNRIHVIDLSGEEPVSKGAVEVGAQPSGMGMSKDGKRVVVANRNGKSVTLLKLDGGIEVTDTVGIDGEAAAVAVAPDGSRALVTKFAEHAVAVVEIEGDNLRYDPGNDIAVGRWPYNVQITPDGKLALVANNGNNGLPDGHTDTVTVVDLEAEPPRAIDHVTVGDGPEGLAISPDGKRAAVPLLQGSAPPFEGTWFHNEQGAIALLTIDGKKVTLAGTVETGAFPEGVGFSEDGKYLYCGDLVDRQLSVFAVKGATLELVKVVPLPGYPASLRTQLP